MDRRAFLRMPASPAETPTQAAPALTPLAISAGLEPHTALLDTSTAAHLLRRSCFGAAPEAIAAYLGQPAADVADALVQEAIDVPLPDAPEWINETPPGRDASQEARQEYRQRNREYLRGWVSNWFMRMVQYGLREKMTLLWHNHFVTEAAAYNGSAQIAYRYVTTLRTHALGNFKQFVYDVGLDPAMLIYLNGVQNRVGAPNENYARELLELFTMGQFDKDGNENYTQQDIEEIARALTGWRLFERDYTVQLVPNRHDDREKTIFGRTGNWGYDDVIDILFEERPRQIAEFIARKLYGEFIYAAPDESLVAELADVFEANDFEIAPVVSALLASAHFFDDQVAGAHVKSPVELIVGFFIELEIFPAEDLFGFVNRLVEPLQQAVLSPPNVAGWPGHHSWLNTTTFVQRWNVVEQLINTLQRTDLIDLATLAEKLHDPADPNAAFTLPVALADHLLAVPLDLLDLSVSGEPFAGDLENNPLPAEIENGPAYVRDLAKLFLSGIPWYEWSLNNDTAGRVIASYVQALKFLPEYQLS